MFAAIQNKISRGLTAAAAALLLAPVAAFTQPSYSSAPLSFSGRALLVLSDADMVASAYADGVLGARAGEDALSAIPLGAHLRDLKAHAVSASNSVAGPPVSVAVTPNGRYAIVAETLMPRPNDDRTDHRFSELKNGRTLLVIDIGELSTPRVVQRIPTFERPEAISINASGDWIAVTFNPTGSGKQTPLALYQFANGRLSEKPFTPAIPGWNTGDALVHAEFHPRENMLALLNRSRDEMSFFQLSTSTGEPSLVTYGNSVRVEKYPYMLRFTPDGRHVIANGLYWGSDVEGNWNEAPRGSVVSIRLNAGKSADGSPRHALVSRARTGVSPEGLTISPDGTMVVTTNLERSFLRHDDPRQTFFSSLTLMRLGVSSGELERVGDFAMDGILPESATFDVSSKSLAVLSYDHYDEKRKGGSVDFWRIARDPLESNRIELVKTSYSVPVMRGAHTVLLVR